MSLLEQIESAISSVFPFEKAEKKCMRPVTYFSYACVNANKIKIPVQRIEMPEDINRGDRMLISSQRTSRCRFNTEEN